MRAGDARVGSLERRLRWTAFACGVTLTATVFVPLFGDESPAEMIRVVFGRLSNGLSIDPLLELLLLTAPYIVTLSTALRQLVRLTRTEESTEANVISAMATALGLAGLALLLYDELGSFVEAGLLIWTLTFLVALPAALALYGFRYGGRRSIFNLVEIGGAGVVVWLAGFLAWHAYVRRAAASEKPWPAAFLAGSLVLLVVLAVLELNLRTAFSPRRDV